MEVKSMKGIKFNEPVIPVKELMEWVEERIFFRCVALGATLGYLRVDNEEADYKDAMIQGKNVIEIAAQLDLLKELKKWLRDYERKE